MTSAAGRQDGARASKTVVLAIAVIIACLATIITYYVRNFGSPPATVTVAEAKQRADLYQQMAQKCHGDFNALSPADQTIVQKASYGQGVMVMQQTASHYGYR